MLPHPPAPAYQLKGQDARTSMVHSELPADAGPRLAAALRQEQRQRLQHLFRQHLRGEVRFHRASRALYSTDASIYRMEPLGVILPFDRADLEVAVAIALEQHLPIVLRGGGTSLSGQAIGTGLIIDTSKYLRQILEIHWQERWVRVAPGVILSELNEQLARGGFQFAPEVAPANRATIGGMIANNSAGSRSIKYGMTKDHVLSLDVVLSDGSKTSFAPKSPIQLRQFTHRRDREAEIYRVVRQILERDYDEILARYPRVPRRASGYNLPELLPPHDLNLSKLVVGSEGTLAVVTEAKLRILPLPKQRGVAVLSFPTLTDALQPVQALLETKPSAVELIDGWIIQLARANPSLSTRCQFLPTAVGAILLVEYSGDSLAAVNADLERLRHGSVSRAITPGTVVLATAAPGLRDELWNLRNLGMPLLLSLPQARKPIAFVEDTAVDPGRLPEFVERFQAILREYGTHGAVYGHASVGCLHIRPFLDLREPADVVRMAQISNAVADLVRDFGGSLSGEHGDGLCRSPHNEAMFGPRLYRSFQEIKAAFDPHQLLNPGKILADAPLTANLAATASPPAVTKDSVKDLPLCASVTSPTVQPSGPVTFLQFGVDGALGMVQRCNGNGLCRRLQKGTMCPSYRATLEEMHTTRGRAKLFQSLVEGSFSATNAPLTEPPHARSATQHTATPTTKWSQTPEAQPVGSALWQDRSLATALSWCLGCKACKTECPSGVDLARIKAEHLYQTRQGRSLTPREQFYRHLRQWQERLAPFAPLVNLLNRQYWFRRVLQSVLRLDARRQLPRCHRTTLTHWFSHRRPRASTAPAPASASASAEKHQVWLLADCFTNHHAPHVGRQAVALLEAHGISVRLHAFCCGRALYSQGFLEEARGLLLAQIESLASAVRDGQPLLVLEPSCLAMIADEWLDLAMQLDRNSGRSASHTPDRPESRAVQIVRAVQKQTWTVEEWLWQQQQAQRLPNDSPIGRQQGLPYYQATPTLDNPTTSALPSNDSKPIWLHGHCQQKALGKVQPASLALAGLLQQPVQLLDTTCCGMAGSFGYDHDTYPLSVAIAEQSLLPQLRQLPTDTVVAAGFSCRCQIHDLTSTRAVHPIELLTRHFLIPLS